MEEEKKRRPRLSKTDPDYSLQERSRSQRPDDESEKPPENTERKPWQERSDRPASPPRDNNREGGGFERKPWQDRSQGGSDRPYQPRDNNREGGGFERKPWQDRSQGGSDRPYQPRDNNREGQPERKPWQDRSPGGPDRPYQPRDNNREGQPERKPWQDRSQGGSDRPYQPRDNNREGQPERKPWQDRSQGGSDRPYQPRDNNREGQPERKPWQDRSQGGSDRPYQPRDNNREGGGGFERKPWQDRSQGGGGGYERKPYNKSGGGGFNKKPAFGRGKPRRDEFFVERKPKPNLPSGAGMPLNKYLAHCGLSSRRKAVEYVEQGLVTVNNEVKMEPYYRMQPGDIVICAGKLVTIQERTIYVLLNKPKNVITTTEDEHGRTTVMDIVDPHFPERIYPVGRLDRDTTGLILLTNDGELAQKLSHPSHSVQKQYRVGLRKPLSEADFKRIEEGIELEDGLVEVNWIRFSEDHPERDIVELEISVGRNRIVRRIFESLGYEVFKLDRFYFAGLTKKELQRGSFRELTQREIIMLKHFTGHPAPKQESLLIASKDEAAVETETAVEPTVEAIAKPAAKTTSKAKTEPVVEEAAPAVEAQAETLAEPVAEVEPEVVPEVKVKKPRAVKAKAAPAVEPGEEEPKMDV